MKIDYTGNGFKLSAESEHEHDKIRQMAGKTFKVVGPFQYTMGYANFGDPYVRMVEVKE